MVFLFRFFSTYAPLIYIGLAIFALFAFRRMWTRWREWRDAVYSLEREFALWRLVRATGIGILAFSFFLAEFYIATFIAPTLPATDLYTTPTLDLLATPQVTLANLDPSQLTLTPVPPPQSGMTGCVKDKIMITSPQSGGDPLSGVVDIIGTADIPNFGFYKYEVAPVGNTQNWATISADRETKKDEPLGKWNTLSVNNGDYFLRLVITDNVGNALDPCIIAVRVLNQ